MNLLILTKGPSINSFQSHTVAILTSKTPTESHLRYEHLNIFSWISSYQMRDLCGNDPQMKEKEN